MTECPQGHCHRWPPGAVLYPSCAWPLWGKTPDTTSARGCGMSVRVSEDPFVVIMIIVESVLRREENEGTADFEFAEDIRRG